MASLALGIRERRLALGLRLRVAKDRSKLDASLAAGLDPVDDPALAWRARQLSSTSRRRAMVSTIANLLDAAEEPPSAFGSEGPQPPLQRQAILAARGELQALAAVLSDSRDITPQAAALVAQLLWDSASPMYATVPGPPLAEVIERILELVR